MRISDWSSDVCSSDLTEAARLRIDAAWVGHAVRHIIEDIAIWRRGILAGRKRAGNANGAAKACRPLHQRTSAGSHADLQWIDLPIAGKFARGFRCSTARAADERGRFASPSGTNKIVTRRSGQAWVSQCRSRWSPYQ